MEKLTFSMENYLEAVYELSGDGKQGVHVSDVATRLSYSKASASNAMNTLSEKGLVTGERYGEVFLTEEGRMAAGFTAKKHQVIRRFFIDVLRINPSVADDDACAIEHVISNDSIRAMQEYMGESGDTSVGKD